MNIREKELGIKDEAIEYIEKTYPETAKEFQQLQYEQYALSKFDKFRINFGLRIKIPIPDLIKYFLLKNDDILYSA